MFGIPFLMCIHEAAWVAFMKQIGYNVIHNKDAKCHVLGNLEHVTIYYMAQEFV